MSILLFIWTILFYVSTVLFFILNIFTRFRFCSVLLLFCIDIVFPISQSICVMLSLDSWSICFHNYVSEADIISRLSPWTSSSMYTLSLVISGCFMALNITFIVMTHQIVYLVGFSPLSSRLRCPLAYLMSPFGYVIGIFNLNISDYYLCPFHIYQLLL